MENDAYTEPMSEHAADPGRFDPQPEYVRPSELARILGWSRPNVYYWLAKCQIPLIDITGYKFVLVSDLPRLVMTLQAAKAAARKGATNG